MSAMTGISHPLGKGARTYIYMKVRWPACQFPRYFHSLANDGPENPRYLGLTRSIAL